ncbi:MAG: restriction endonuclease subunit R, partial [Floccifex sp.]
MEEIEQFMSTWKEELLEEKGLFANSLLNDRPKPWKKKNRFVKEDVIGKLHIVLSDGVYIDTLNLMPRIQNQIRSMAAFDNPEFYKNKRLGYSNYYNFSTIYLGKDEDGYIKVPRGLREQILEKCKEAGIIYDISD